MAIGCGAQCAKILLIVFNIIFWLSGAAILGLGIWMFVDDDVSNNIKVLQSLDEGGPLIRYAAIILIVAGGIVLIVGFLGCCGAIKESRCMLGLYIAFMVLIMAVEIAAAVVAIFFRDQVTDDLEKELLKQLRKRYVGPGSGTGRQKGSNATDEDVAFSEGVDYIQQELKCCGITDNAEEDYGNTGVNAVSDETPSPWWTATGIRPPSCCMGGISSDNCPAGYFEKGCRQELEDWIKDNSIILMVVGFIVAGIEIFGFIFAICLCRNVGEED